MNKPDWYMQFGDWKWPDTCATFNMAWNPSTSEYDNNEWWWPTVSGENCSETINLVMDHDGRIYTPD